MPKATNQIFAVYIVSYLFSFITDYIIASVFDNLSDSNKALMLSDIVNGNEKLILDKFVSTTGIRQVTFEPVEHTNLLKAVDHVFGQKNIPDFDIDNASLILKSPTLKFIRNCLICMKQRLII